MSVSATTIQGRRLQRNLLARRAQPRSNTRTYPGSTRIENSLESDTALRLLFLDFNRSALSHHDREDIFNYAFADRYGDRGPRTAYQLRDRYNNRHATGRGRANWSVIDFPSSALTERQLELRQAVHAMLVRSASQIGIIIHPLDQNVLVTGAQSSLSADALGPQDSSIASRSNVNADSSGHPVGRGLHVQHMMPLTHPVVSRSEGATTTTSPPTRLISQLSLEPQVSTTPSFSNTVADQQVPYHEGNSSLRPSFTVSHEVPVGTMFHAAQATQVSHLHNLPALESWMVDGMVFGGEDQPVPERTRVFPVWAVTMASVVERSLAVQRRYPVLSYSGHDGPNDWIVHRLVRADAELKYRLTRPHDSDVVQDDDQNRLYEWRPSSILAAFGSSQEEPTRSALQATASFQRGSLLSQCRVLADVKLLPPLDQQTVRTIHWLEQLTDESSSRDDILAWPDTSIDTAQVAAIPLGCYEQYDINPAQATIAIMYCFGKLAPAQAARQLQVTGGDIGWVLRYNSAISEPRIDWIDGCWAEALAYAQSEQAYTLYEEALAAVAMH